MLRSILLNYKLDIDVTQNEKYSFVISCASGERSFNEIKNWIEKNSIEITE